MSNSDEPQEIQIRSLYTRTTRDPVESRRVTRMKDNARFAGNPHIVLPQASDYDLNHSHTNSTFPVPLPPYLPRSVPLPASVAPPTEPATANAGRFTISMKGTRKVLRRHAFRSRDIVQSIEVEILAWLQTVHVVIGSQLFNEDSLNLPGRTIAPQISEVHRSFSKLIWNVAQDSFSRYIIHCCCRFHQIVSFSKDVDGMRLTYLIRPAPFPSVAYSMPGWNTPPATDMESVGSIVADAAHPELLVGSIERSSIPEECSPVDLPSGQFDDTENDDPQQRVNSDNELSQSIESLALVEPETQAYSIPWTTFELELRDSSSAVSKLNRPSTFWAYVFK